MVYIKMKPKFTIINLTPLYIKPSLTSAKHCDIPYGAIVQHNGETDIMVGAMEWCEIMYVTNLKTYVGWIPSHLIEPFTQSFLGSNLIKTSVATQSESDFEQNLIYKNQVQFNLLRGILCSVLCRAL